MPPKKVTKAAKPAAPKTKAPAKVAAAAPKKSASVASRAKAKVPEAKPVAGSKRKAVDEEVEAPKRASKRAKPAEKIEAPEPKKAAATKVTKPAAKKPAAKKPAAKEPAPKKITPIPVPTKAAPKKASPKKAAPAAKPAAKAPAKKATPPAEAAPPKTNGVKRKADASVDVPPAAKNAKAGNTTTLNGETKEKTAKARAAAEAKAKKDAEKAKKAAETKAKKAAARPKKVVAPKPPRPVRVLPTINTPPTTKLDIYVFGEGSAGELGLGIGKDPSGKSVVDVKRPRLNHNLLADKVGVVQIAVGGMHCVALTADNKILTWGVNDQGALGRPTDAGPMKDMAASDEDSDDEGDAADDLNASEATPAEVDTANFAEGTKFASVYASDNASFAITTTGLVYGWGTFRGNEGVLGFRFDEPKGENQANSPILISELKDIVEMACGTNHVLALTNKGKVFTWGAGEQNQLARRVMARSLKNGLVPREFGLGRKKIVKIGAGDYHSFVIDDKGIKYGWGLNTFGQTGVGKKSDTDDIVMQPTPVDVLKGYEIKQIFGGAHHTIACTKDNKVIIWGRCDGHQMGVETEDIPKNIAFMDADGKPRFVEKPLELEMQGACVATAGDTCVVIDTDGVAWSWGFSEAYQTGQGQGDDVEEATEIDNTAVRGKKLVFAGLGGQFGLVAGEPSVENGAENGA
ncbi:RCC1/BLIP-II protein [Mollisia scopiformis]|uniref:RCC1/BLIP-II protein n=1 Tax=Mollisia scopiformis TaxID=149040 RepID=A0A194XL01_MOLSC|nr:RCC1/BLIP-II protein [Mollisia scopiformis]KUJ20774.1 RCC1/BLIP-II protein [Mollisia scopiformis]